MGVLAYPGNHKDKKHHSCSRCSPWLDSLKEERRKAATWCCSPRSPQTPNHSLPWYKVVELVRTEDLLDLFFYFCLVRMQETGERKQIQMRPPSAFSSYCHKCLLARVGWYGLELHSTVRQGFCRMTGLGQGERESPVPCWHHNGLFQKPNP